jgi:hypothetical protein
MSTTAQQPPRCETIAPDHRSAFDVAVGEAGRRVARLAERGWYDSVRQTSALGQAVDDLIALYPEVHHPGWDGYKARPVSGATFDRAVAFLRALPHSVPTPDVIPEPTGTIAFEWQQAPDLVFSVSITEGYALAFAGLFGRNKIYGTEAFVDEFPKPLFAHLRRIYPEEAKRKSA